MRHFLNSRRRFGNGTESDGDSPSSSSIPSTELPPSLEQSRRRDVVRRTCLANQVTRTATLYRSSDPRQSQSLPDLWRWAANGKHRGQFLSDDALTHTLYCYNHKAASSTWMAAFVHLHPDPKMEEKLAGKTYQIADHMTPSSPAELMRRVDSGSYFAFTVVRHPFDRLLSAFRDRILNGCTYQAKTFNPRIFSKLRLKHL